MTAIVSPDLTASLMRVQAHQQNLQQESLVSEADKTRMRDKAKEFESFFIYQSMELMKTQSDNEFDGGHGEEIFRHTLNEHMAKSITDAGGFGIADTVYAQLLKQQEARAETLANAAKTYRND